MKSIVVYESRYGSTERYAKWIGEELNCKVSKIKDVSIDELLNYDNIVFGGWLEEGKIKGLKDISKNYQKLKNKNLIIYYVGLSIINDEMQREIRKNNFQDMDNIKDFYMRGAFNYENLNIIHKVMMSMFKFILKKQKDMDENTKGMLQAYEIPVDFTKKENIKPLIEAVNI